MRFLEIFSRQILAVGIHSTINNFLVDIISKKSSADYKTSILVNNLKR